MKVTRGTTALGRGATWALVVLTALALPAAAQEGGGRDTADQGWIGVGIRQAVRCESRPAPEREDGASRRPAECRPVVVAGDVIRGAPAHRAGLRPGDTLIAVNGRALSRRSGQDELLSFEPGQPAQLLVGRRGGRVSLRVVPEARPEEAGSAPVWVEAGKAARAPASARPRVLATPDSAEGEPRTAAGAAPGIRAAAFRVGEDGDLYVEWPEGDSVRLRRFEEVAPRIREIRDSVFSMAREHLEEVRKHQREALRSALEARREQVREAADARGGEADFPVPGGAPEPLPPGTRLRVAGAEFRPLSGPLAEYFPGVDHGLLVLQVVPGTPAAALGLRTGDVVVEAGDRQIVDAADLRRVLSRYATSARDSLAVKWIRKGQEMTGALSHR